MEKRSPVLVKFPPDLLAEIDAFAAHGQTTRMAAIVNLCWRGLSEGATWPKPPPDAESLSHHGPKARDKRKAVSVDTSAAEEFLSPPGEPAKEIEPLVSKAVPPKIAGVEIKPAAELVPLPTAPPARRRPPPEIWDKMKEWEKKALGW